MLTQSQEKYQEVLEVAETLYRQNPDWVTFFREVLGVEGTVRKAFPTFDELTAFEQSPQFDKIQKLLVRLREKRSNVDVETEPTRVITVRLPKSMHEYLRTEAHDLRTSMNKLCISKLLQVIGEDMIPNERTGGEIDRRRRRGCRRGRRRPAGPAFTRTPEPRGASGRRPARRSASRYQPQTPPPFKPVQAACKRIAIRSVSDPSGSRPSKGGGFFCAYRSRRWHRRPPADRAGPTVVSPSSTYGITVGGFIRARLHLGATAMTRRTSLACNSVWPRRRWHRWRCSPGGAALRRRRLAAVPRARAARAAPTTTRCRSTGARPRASSGRRRCRGAAGRRR